MQEVKYNGMEFETLEVAGFMPALIGMRYPMNSDDRMDTIMFSDENNYNFEIGSNDLRLAHKLISAGSEHSKFLRMIQVWARLKMPRYWWVQMDTYHFHTQNSRSTMHKMFERDFEYNDFNNTEDSRLQTISVIKELNKLRNRYLGYKLFNDSYMANKMLLSAKMILPESYLQERIVNFNYAEIFSIYKQRKNHKLSDEWVLFMNWAEQLPQFLELFANVKGESN